MKAIQTGPVAPIEDPTVRNPARRAKHGGGLSVHLRTGWLAGALLLLVFPTAVARGAASVYYVSSSMGNDSFDGRSASAPFRSISKVNGLELLPGDRVLFRCGDTWRAEELVISRSGADGQPITFGSYPDAGCANKPALTGAQPVSGWSVYSGNIYVANLAAGANIGKFPNGVNQMFRGSERLPMGRWPNIDAADGGYSEIESQPAANRFNDSALPAADWTGAVAHIRGMRWYILNREVAAGGSGQITVDSNLDCWSGNCAGWGYFLNNHLATLDLEGEWYYQASTQKVYLVSASGAPADGVIDASVVLRTNDRSSGGIQLGVDLNERGPAHINVENLAVIRWYRHGIAAPTNWAHSESHHIVLRNNLVRDVDGIGINLMSWVWGADDGRADGWRGGYAMTLSGNTVERANAMGLNFAGRESEIADNTLRDIARIGNLGAAGMGCAFDAGEGACTEDGDGIRIKNGGIAEDTANHNTLTGNRLERVGYNGFDVFGHGNTFLHNVISEACISKGDCGAVRTFGSGDLGSTPVYDLVFQENILLDTIGNTDGCRPEFDARFGFGLYIDNYSRNVVALSNTIAHSTAAGILYQNSTGTATGNTLYNNAHGFDWGGQVVLTGAPTVAAAFQTNTLFALRPNAWTLDADSASQLTVSDNNRFFHPYRAQHIYIHGVARALPAWVSASGKDSHSTDAWYTQPAGQEPRSQLFVNDSAIPVTIPLGATAYLDLDQQPVTGSVALPAYSARILVENGTVAVRLDSLQPAFWDVDTGTGLTLIVTGIGFTPQSAIRWNGSGRTTSFLSESRLSTELSDSDVASIGAVSVTVYEPSSTPSESNALLFRLVADVYSLLLPVVFR